MPRKKPDIKPVKKPLKRETRNLLLFVGAALLIVGAAVGFVAWQRVAGKQYLGKSVMLAPDVLTGARSMDEIEPEGRLMRSWVFSRVDFYDAGWRHHEVKPEAYARFYEMIAGERSVRRADELACHFEGRVPTLVLSLDPAGKYAAAYNPRQSLRVQFSPDGELFRVEVKRGWAYFHSPGIGHEAQKLLLRHR